MIGFIRADDTIESPKRTYVNPDGVHVISAITTGNEGTENEWRRYEGLRLGRSGLCFSAQVTYAEGNYKYGSGETISMPIINSGSDFRNIILGSSATVSLYARSKEADSSGTLVYTMKEDNDLELANKQYVDTNTADIVKYSEQTLTEEQQAQARTNIGAEALGSADAALTSANTYTDEKVAGIVNSAPETLDTLNELAAALGNDENFATTVATQIGSKVDKVDGKGLSTEDYTTEEKEKLAGISTKLSNFENDAGFITSIPEEYATDAVRYSAQTLTDEHKAQARTNIETERIIHVTQWDSSTGAPDIRSIVCGYGGFGIVNVGGGNGANVTISGGTMHFPAFVICGGIERARQSFDVIDSYGQYWSGEMRLDSQTGYVTLKSNSFTTEEKEKLAGISTKLSGFENDVGFITSIPEEYVTDTELTAKGYLTSYTETDPTVPDWAKSATKPTYTAAEVGALPDDTVIPTKTSDLTNDSGFLTSIPSEYITETELSSYGYLTSYTETDPTVPEWAKQSAKPTYTASEVGALPDTTTIPTKTSDLTNDSGFLTSIPSEYITETELSTYGYLTSYTETDPTVPAWAKEANKPTYTAAEVGALPADTVIPSIDGLATESYVDNAVSAKITAPTTATVGQILSVKSVDTNGAPTEWETVDYNSVTEDRVNELITAALATTQSYYTGTADPEDSLGSDGDIYLKTT